MRMCSLALAAAIAAASVPAAFAQISDPDVVFENSFNNGFFTPFDASTSPGVRYGDSGWLSNPTDDTFKLTEITLGLMVFGGASGAPAGTTDISFTFNDGDPSGLVFGPGTALFSTTVLGVVLPEAAPNTAVPFSLTIPLPSIETSGGFNNIGWGVGVEGFSYDGSFGFQASTASGQSTGFFTANASFFSGSSWSLFSFGGDPETGVANFVAEIRIPTPASVALLIAASPAVLRRSRS